MWTNKNVNQFIESSNEKQRSSHGDDDDVLTIPATQHNIKSFGTIELVNKLIHYNKMEETPSNRM